MRSSIRRAILFIMMKFHIQILHNNQCTFWQSDWALLERLKKEGRIDAEPEEVLVDTDEKAKQYRFFGSPQVLINGQDVDPMAVEMSNFHWSGCRPYFYKDQMYDYAPEGMIMEAVARITEK